jgi:hypothetical protein
VITIRFARAYLKAGISAERAESEERERRDYKIRVSEDFEQREREEESRKRATKKRIASQRIQEFESRQFEGSRVDGSRVREFELDSGVIPTGKSEINKESGKSSGGVCYSSTSTAIPVQHYT